MRKTVQDYFFTKDLQQMYDQLQNYILNNRSVFLTYKLDLN